MCVIFPSPLYAKSMPHTHPVAPPVAVALRSADAVAVDGSEYTFDLRRRIPATRLQLASIEWPLSQPPVRAGRTRLYMHDGVRLGSQTLVVECAERATTVVLPLDGTRATVGADGIVTCDARHGLWRADGTWAADRVSLICDTASGRLVLTPDNAECIDATRFRVAHVGAGAAELSVAAWESMDHLCAYLTRRLGAPYRLEYDASADACALAAPHRVTCRGDLARELGLEGASGCDRVSGTRVGKGAIIEVPVGWYAPAHRPTVCGTPPRLAAELERQINRFDLPAKALLFFRDPLGVPCRAEFAPGRYTRQSLAAALAAALRSASSTAFRDRGGTFDASALSCGFEVRARWSEAAPPTWTLDFTNAESLDAARLGFLPQVYASSTVYHSTLPRGDLHTLVRVEEVTARKRFVFHTPLPPPTRATCEPLRDGCFELRTRSECGASPHSAGLRASDVVAVAAWGGGVPVHGVVREVGADCTGPYVRVFAPVGVGGVGDVTVYPIETPTLSVSCAMPDAIPPAVLGLPGDRTVSTRAGRLECPHAYNLEHVDYVNIAFDSSTANQHESFLSSHGRALRSIWTKFVTASIYREERLLPKELHIGRSDLCRFSMKFTNPDGTPYDLQGGAFSFTIIATAPL